MFHYHFSHKYRYNRFFVSRWGIWSWINKINNILTNERNTSRNDWIDCIKVKIPYWTISEVCTVSVEQLIWRLNISLVIFSLWNEKDIEFETCLSYVLLFAAPFYHRAFWLVDTEREKPKKIRNVFRCELIIASGGWLSYLTSLAPLDFSQHERAFGAQLVVNGHGYRSLQLIQ